MNRSKILVTGISSEIMQRFVRLIDNNQFELVGITRNRSNLGHLNINIIEGDLTDMSSLGAVMRGCNMVIHAAAITHSFDARAYFKMNLEATQKLVETANIEKVQKFVFVSSRAAGNSSGAYGQSKLQAEEYIRNHVMDWLVFRPAEVFGGTKSEGIEGLIINAFRKKVMVCPTGVESKLYPIDQGDVAMIMHDLIFNKKISRKKITINGDQGFTMSEIVRLASQIAQKRTIIFPIPRMVMFAIGWALKTFNIRIGIMPDQIPRLYSAKEKDNLGYELKTLQDHLSHLKTVSES